MHFVNLHYEKRTQYAKIQLIPLIGNVRWNMNIVIWLCFAIMLAILITSIVNIARRGRADRLEYYNNYKKGKFWAIYFVAIPLFFLANTFSGSASDEAFFDAVESSVDLIVLKYDYSSVKPLMDANPSFRAVMWTCFVMVALNASFLAVTIACRRVLNHAWKERAKSAKKCYVVVGFNPQNKNIVKSIVKKSKHANCIIVAKEVNEDLKKFAFVQKVSYAKAESADDFAKNLRAMFKDFDNRSVEVIVNTGDEKGNLTLAEQIAGVIGELSLEKYGSEGDRGLNAYVFGEPENMSTYLKIVQKTSGLVHYVNKYKLVAYDFVGKYPLTEFMDEEQIDYSTATIKPDVSLNVALIGFGKANRQIFLTSVENNQFMSIEDGKLVPKLVNYWIYDKKDARNDKNLNHDYYRFEQELGKEKYLPLPCKPANEMFFELDINDDEFYKSLHENLGEQKGEKKYNYLIIAFGSDLENLDFAEKICTKLKEWEIFDKTKVFVKIRDDKLKNDVIGGFEKDNEQFIVFGNENELVYNVDAIVNEENESMAKDRHFCYELAYVYESAKAKAQASGIDSVQIDEAKEKLNATKSWYTQSQFQREANIYAVLAIKMKLQLMGFDFCKKSEEKKDASDKFMSVYECGDPIVYDGSEIEGRKGVKYTNDFKLDSLRGRMAIQEHQRWNAYAITCGMIPMPIEKMEEGKFKDFELRKHGCLTTFEGLVEYRKIKARVEHKSEEKTDVIRYDYQIMDDAEWLLARFGKKIVEK